MDDDGDYDVYDYGDDGHDDGDDDDDELTIQKIQYTYHNPFRCHLNVFVNVNLSYSVLLVYVTLYSRLSMEKIMARKKKNK